MMYDNGIDLSRRNELFKSNNSKEYIFFHLWSLNHGFRFRNCVCNGSHYLMMLCLNIP